MDKFQNKYRISSARLKNWDYRWAGACFVTICTRNRKCYFGEITDGTRTFSGVGILADVFWYEIKNREKNVELGEFVVMPNHVHGILILNGNDGGSSVEALHATPLRSQPIKNEIMAAISPKSSSVSTIIRSYKSVVTKHAHRLGFEIEWQTRIHDHIIRDNDEYQRIADYISANPRNWADDNLY